MLFANTRSWLRGQGLVRVGSHGRLCMASVLVCLVASCRSGASAHEAVEARSRAARQQAPDDPGEDARALVIDTEENLPVLEYQLRKAMVSEAKVGLAVISDSAINSVGERGICGFVPEGRVGPTPPSSVVCDGGPDGECVPVDPPRVPEEPWEYSSELWTASAWKHIGYQAYDGHRYRYSLEWKAVEGDEHFPCHVKVTAEGDLDGDGVASRFTRVVPLRGQAGDSRRIVEIENEFE